MKVVKRDNLGQTFYVKTQPAPCRNSPEFTELAVKTAHESRAVYNACIRILVEAEDEDMPLRSRDGYKEPSLQEALLALRKTTPWLQEISSNVRRSAAAQAHTAFGHWVEAQRKNAWKLARASDLKEKRRKILTRAAKLKESNPARYRRSREETLESVQDIRRNARKLRAKVEKYARRSRDPLRMMRTRKYAERRQRLTFPLIAGKVHFINDNRTEFRVHGFGDIELKNPLPDGMEPVSLTLVARRKRRHRKKRGGIELEQLEWSAHVQYRRYVEQKPVTPEAPSVGVDPGIKHAATTQDNQGRVTHYHYTGTKIEERERRLKNLRRRRAECTIGSRRWQDYNLEIRRTSKRLTNLRRHQTEADNARRSARGTHRGTRQERAGQVRPEPGARLLEAGRAEAGGEESQRTTGGGLEPDPPEEHEPVLRPVRLHGQGTAREPSKVPMPRVRPHSQRRRQRRRERPAGSR